MKRVHASRGMALLEALLAAALLATGAAGLIHLQARLTTAGEAVRHEGEALWLAQQALEEARDTLQVPASRWTGRNSSFEVEGTAEALISGSPDPFPIRHLTVRVSWTDRQGRPHQRHLHTLVSSANRSLHAWLTRADG